MSTEEILAINYYDGVTEGFLIRSTDSRVEYFRLIGWDRYQDQRLFVIADVDPSALSRLEEFLGRSGQHRDRRTWLPEWRFGGNRDSVEADQILEQCRKKLVDVGRFVFGAKPEIALPLAWVTEDTRQDVLKAMSQSSIDDIEQWLKKLRS